MTALAFVAFFVLLGLATVYVAMQGGPRGARERMQSQSRRGRKTTAIAVFATVAIFGVVVPALVLVYNGDDQASAGPSGTRLTASLREGREMFARNCATCHQLDNANAVGRVGPDLDALRPTAALTLNAIEEGRARGMGQMPADLLEGTEARQVARYVAAVAGR